MKSTVTLEIEHSEEWEVAEPAIRRAKHGEAYLNDNGDIVVCSLAETSGCYPIMRRVRWKPKTGETYWTINIIGKAVESEWEGHEGDERRHADGHCFRSKEAAERAWDKALEMFRATPDEER